MNGKEKQNTLTSNQQMEENQRMVLGVIISQQIISLKLGIHRNISNSVDSCLLNKEEVESQRR